MTKLIEALENGLKKGIREIDFRLWLLSEMIEDIFEERKER